MHCVSQGVVSAARSITAQLKFNIYHEKIKLSQEMDPSLEDRSLHFLTNAWTQSLLNINVQRSHDLFVSPHTIWPQNSLPPRKFLFHSLPLCWCGQGLYERLTIFPFTRICMSFQFGGTEPTPITGRGLMFRHLNVF